MSKPIDLFLSEDICIYIMNNTLYTDTHGDEAKLNKEQAIKLAEFILENFGEEK